jgi:hypothetical protein
MISLVRGLPTLFRFWDLGFSETDRGGRVRVGRWGGILENLWNLEKVWCGTGVVEGRRERKCFYGCKATLYGCKTHLDGRAAPL